MEAYFQNDPRIKEWIDQITEKVFTVCLLTGADADAELQRGSQIVTKVSTILLGISLFPSGLLADGLRQLIEQQLPDDRVIKNFPSFYASLNKMLNEGIPKALEGRQEEVQNETVEVLNEIVNEMDKEENLKLSIEVDEPFSSRSRELEPPIANQESKDNQSADNSPECLKQDLGNSEANITVTQIDQLDEIQSPLERFKHTIHLKHVLHKIFPNSSVHWNINIMGLTFVAQVENILIYVYNSETEYSSIMNERLKKEGWKIFVCSPEELSFPRRVEREIREILRSGKKSFIV